MILPSIFAYDSMAEVYLDEIFGTRQSGNETKSDERSVFIQFIDTNGEETGTPVFVPCSSSVSALTDILTTLRERVKPLIPFLYDYTFYLRILMSLRFTNSSLETLKS